MPSAISIKNLTKHFGDCLVIDDFSLEVAQSAITVILAPSGAGKTTLLRILAGLEQHTEGHVIFHDHELSEPGPEIGFIFQEPSAFPWLTVRQNIEFGARLKANRGHIQNSAARAAELCVELGLERQMDYFPRQLSGGQKQRVALGRALILQPSLLLMDESFSALDEMTRSEMRQLLLQLHQHYQPTVIFITHHIEEALFLADELVLCTASPLRFKEQIPVRYPVPRNNDLLESREFLDLKARIRKQIQS
jgi:NitT/TauT family transport system ATP-binding protein